jgi:anti-sigma factor ChrR (cupin superfamily)
MTRQEFETLAAGHALGMLAPAEAARFEALLSRDPRARAEAAEFIDAAAAFAARSSPPVAPPPELRARILAMIASTPQMAPPPAAESAAAGFHFVPRSEEGWTESGAAGFRIKLLSDGADSGRRIILAELAPGARVPEHDHAGAEDVFILSGHLETEGRTLGPGDFLHSAAGTHHRECHSPDGCLALLIVGTAHAA